MYYLIAELSDRKPLVFLVVENWTITEKVTHKGAGMSLPFNTIVGPTVRPCNILNLLLLTLCNDVVMS